MYLRENLTLGPEETGKRRAWWPQAESRRQGGCSSWEEVGIHTTGTVRNSRPDAAEQ